MYAIVINNYRFSITRPDRRSLDSSVVGRLNGLLVRMLGEHGDRRVQGSSKPQVGPLIQVLYPTLVNGIVLDLRARTWRTVTTFRDRNAIRQTDRKERVGIQAVALGSVSNSALARASPRSLS